MSYRASTEQYITRVARAVSVLINVVLGGADEQTFSARQHELRRRRRKNCTHLIDRLFGKGHCQESWVNWRLNTKHRSWTNDE